jgi:hypothetical protein
LKIYFSPDQHHDDSLFAHAVNSAMVAHCTEIVAFNLEPNTVNVARNSLLVSCTVPVKAEKS